MTKGQCKSVRIDKANTTFELANNLTLWIDCDSLPVDMTRDRNAGYFGTRELLKIMHLSCTETTYRKGRPLKFYVIMRCMGAFDHRLAKGGS